MKIKHLPAFLFGTCLLAITSSALWAQDNPGDVGLGAYIGTPFGFSGKYLLDGEHALDLAVGAQGGDLAVHGDFLVHFRNVAPQPRYGKFAPYIGLGLKLRDQEDMLVGFRFVGGLSYIIQNTPLEAFAEIAPLLRVAPSVGSNIDGGIGLRYYFGTSPSSRDTRRR